jgi:hypothetical protein
MVIKIACKSKTYNINRIKVEALHSYSMGLNLTSFVKIEQKENMKFEFKNLHIALHMHSKTNSKSSNLKGLLLGFKGPPKI